MKKVYTLWTFGAGTAHVVTDKELAQRWKASNRFRGYTEWEPDSRLEQVVREIEEEEAKGEVGWGTHQ